MQPNFFSLKINDLKQDPWISLWIIRFLEYLTLFIAVIICGNLLFWKFNAFPTEGENVFFLVSVIVQIQATIVSLVITLTLVAIQITAASYTPRVVDVMKKMPDMWFLLVIYIESISIGIVTLKFLTNPDPSSVSSIIILGIFSFCSLFLYMKNTITFLHPDQVVKMLVNEINVDNLHQKKWTDDIMQPVFDVVHTSLIRYDVTTVRTGLKAISDRLLEIFLMCDNLSRKDISKHFCSHIRRSARVAQRNDDEGIIIEIIEVLEKFGVECCKNKDSDIVRPVIDVITEIGINSADKRWDYETWRVINTLGKIGLNVTKNGLGDATKGVAFALELVNTHAADKEMETIQIIGEILASLYEHADNNGLSDSAESILRVLGSVGQYNADRSAELATFRLIYSIEKLGIYTTDKNQRCETWNIVSTLVEVGEHVAKKRLKATRRVVDALEKLGSYASTKRDFNDIAEMAIRSREDIIASATAKKLVV